LSDGKNWQTGAGPSGDEDLDLEEVLEHANLWGVRRV